MSRFVGSSCLDASRQVTRPWPNLCGWLIVATFLLSGCAGLTVTPVDKEADDKVARGFRYYESTPFLLVHTDNKGGLVSQIVFLPDESKKRSIHPFSTFSSNVVTLEFDRGILNKAVQDVDATAVPAALISAMEKSLKATLLAAASTAPSDAPKIPAPYLFRIKIEGSKVTLVGGQPEKNTEINFSK